MRPPVVERSYILVTNQYYNGDPFGYVSGNNFVLVGPSEDVVYLCDASGEITYTNQRITDADKDEIIAQIAVVYPSVTGLTYEIATFSVGDTITIGGTV